MEKDFWFDRKATTGNHRLLRATEIARVLISLVERTRLEHDDSVTQSIMLDLAKQLPVNGMEVTFVD